MSNTILIGQSAQLSVTLRTDGNPVVIDDTAVLKAMLYTADARTKVADLADPAADAAGAMWAEGIVEVDIPDIVTEDLQPGNLVLTITGPFGAKRFPVSVEAVDVPVHSLLFVRDIAVDEIRQDRLTAAGALLNPAITLTDDYIWAKLIAAEAEISRELRVPLVPTKFFPIQPTQEQLDALPEGMPWAVDPGYDYDPGFFRSERWGYLLTRQVPVQSVESVTFVYPDQVQGLFHLPLDWIRIDAKYGHIRFVPSTSTFAAPLSAFLMQALGGGRTIPFMIQIIYVAGLANAQQDYPDLIDVIKKMAVLKIVQDRFLPSSGSISADGLSQSMSVQMDSYQDFIDHTLNGPKGSNGGLMTAIHGVRFGAFGGA